MNPRCPILLLEEIIEKTIEVIKMLRVKCIHVINITDTTLMADNNRCLLEGPSLFSVISGSKTFEIK